MLVHVSANRQIIMAASEQARRHGIRPGMTLAQARALCAKLRHAEHDPAGDRRALEALGRWMMRFTPIVAAPADADAVDLPFHLFLDVTGCERVFHGLDNLQRRVAGAMARFGFTARLAIGPTPGAAWTLAYAGRPSVIGDLRFEISDLPLESLRLDAATVESLHHLGLESIGDLMKLPRAALPARFGRGVLLRLDQAMGAVAEPLTALSHAAPLREAMEFEYPVASLDAIWIVCRELLMRLIQRMSNQGLGARRVEVELGRSFSGPLRRTILLSRASRDIENLMRLFRCAMEDEMADDRAGGLENDGFTSLRIAVPVWQKLAHEQIRLVEAEEYAGRVEVERLIEHLRARMGERAVTQADLIASYLPERACRDVTDSATVSLMSAPFSSTPTLRYSDAPTLPQLPHRPLHLLPQPAELRVMVLPLDDQAGRPVAFTVGGQTRRVVHFVGPERIAGQWWEGHNRTRDYFDVEDPTGRRWWIFRVIENGRWFLHGMFA